MSDNKRYTIVSTKFGWVGIVGAQDGLDFLSLPLPSAEAALSGFKNRIPNLVEDAAWFDDLASRLQRYFNGANVDFPDKLDFSKATSFQKRVWMATRAIPYGATQSYGWIASQIGIPKAARAVGSALASNPFPIIVPCHRVLASDGSLSGFSGGLGMKKRLLRLERTGMLRSQS